MESYTHKRRMAKKPGIPSLKMVAMAAANALSVLVTVFFIGVLGFLVYSMLAAKDGEGNISIGPFACMTVVTGSMEPAVSVGDVVVVYKGELNAVSVGDVITFHPYGESSVRVTHRVTEITPDGILTKGDANNAADKNPVTPLTYIGKVVFVIPLIGALLSKPIGIAMFAGIFLVYALLEAAVKESIKKRHSRKTEDLPAAGGEDTEKAVAIAEAEAVAHAIESAADAEALMEVSYGYENPAMRFEPVVFERARSEAEIEEGIDREVEAIFKQAREALLYWRRIAPIAAGPSIQRPAPVKALEEKALKTAL